MRLRRWLLSLLVLMTVGVVAGDHTRASTPIAFTEHGIDLSGPVDSELSLQFAIHFPDLTPDETGSVYVFIDSPGGYITEGKLISDLIEQSPYRTVCVVTDEAASMAFYILQSCNRRLAFETSHLMMHEPAVMVPPFTRIDRHVARALADSLEESAKEVADHCSKRMAIPRETYDNAVRGKDWVMTPQVALVVGAIDDIVPKPPGS